MPMPSACERAVVSGMSPRQGQQRLIPTSFRLDTDRPPKKKRRGHGPKRSLSKKSLAPRPGLEPGTYESGVPGQPRNDLYSEGLSGVTAITAFRP